jgi:hypothetical protein
MKYKTLAEVNNILVQASMENHSRAITEGTTGIDWIVDPTPVTLSDLYIKRRSRMKTALCYIAGLFSKRYRLHYHTKHDGV